MQLNIFRQPKTAYEWLVESRQNATSPTTTDIKLQIFKGSELVVDEIISEANGLSGGRVGLYVQSQENVFWSKMSTERL